MGFFAYLQEAKFYSGPNKETVGLLPKGNGRDVDA